MKTATLTSVLALLAASVSAAPQAPVSTPTAVAGGGGTGGAPPQVGPVSITQPTQGATLVAGGQQTVAWQNPQGNITQLIINLLQGDPAALEYVQTLATGVDPAAGSYDVEIPKNASGSGYALGVGPDDNNMAYIGQLTISTDPTQSVNASLLPAPAASTTTSPTTPTAAPPIAKRQEIPTGGASPSDPAGGASPSDPAGGALPSDPAGGALPSDPAGGALPSDPAGGALPSDPAGGALPSDPAGGALPSDPAGGALPSDPAGGAGGAPSASGSVGGGALPSGPAGGSSAPSASGATGSGAARPSADLEGAASTRTVYSFALALPALVALVF